MRAFAFVLLLLLSFNVFAQDETIEIEFVHIFGGEGDIRADVIQAIAEDFMAENPNIVVNIRSTSTEYGELFNAALLAASQGDAPHVVQVEDALSQQAADSGFFLPITEVASDEQLAQQDDVLPVVTDYYTINDVQWSLPWNSSNPVMYYNKTITDALGFEISSDEPLTFAELSGFCEQVMAAAEELEVGACANWPVASWFAEQWITMQGGLLANNNNGRTDRATEMLLTSEEMLNVTTWWKDMVDNGYYIYGGTPDDFNGEGLLFLTTPTVFHFNSTAGLTLFKGAFEQFGLELGVAPLPIPNEDATNGVTVGGASVWVTDGHPEEEIQAAVDFAFYLVNPENDIRWHQGTGYFPNRSSSIDLLSEGGFFVDAEGNPTTPDAEGATEVPWFEAQPEFRIAVEQLLNSESSFANAGPVVGPMEEVRRIMEEAFISMIDGGFSPQEAMEAAKSRADSVLEEYNAVVTGE